MVKAKVAITEEVLGKVAKELNKVLGLEAPDNLKLTKKGGIEGLKADILLASNELTEDDDVSKFTLGILKDLKSPKKAEKKEEKKEEKKAEKKEEKITKKTIEKKGKIVGKYNLREGSFSQKAFELFLTGKFSMKQAMEKIGSKTDFQYLLRRIKDKGGKVETINGKILVS